MEPQTWVIADLLRLSKSQPSNVKKSFANPQASIPEWTPLNTGSSLTEDTWQ